MSPKARSKTRSASPLEEISFEDANQELEKIVRQLEAGQLSLDEALALFERGQALAERCGARLAEAELRVQALLPGDSGQWEEGDLELEE